MAELDTTREAERFPIQPEKLDAPPLGPDTLHRERLVGWLDRRIHHRVVLVVAEAGFGKTTLLADFASRTRLPTIWYRLDDGDRDPVAVLNYLVAAGRRLLPDFAPATAAMLRDLGTAGVSHEQLVRTFVSELQGLGSGPIVLLLDDLHHVDDVPEVRSLLREMLARAPERFTFVLSTRRVPVLPLSRLRTRGELTELTTEDLRFLPEETERLFREAYRQPLDPDLSRELTDRTQGWAATLQLVRTAVRERDPAEIRSFIRGLDGRSEDLHDFLAEEVVGDLEPARRRFLMRTSILQVVTPELAAVVDDVDPAGARHHIEEAERLGLLSRRGQPRWRHRYHPLVRDFLVERLTREAGVEAVRDLHRTVAQHADGVDWRLAAYHWSQADEPAELHRVLADAVAAIMGTGEFALADGYLADHPPSEPTAAFEIVLSRLDFYRNRTDSALARARWASETAAGAHAALAALANQASLEFMAGEFSAARSTATSLAEASDDPVSLSIAEGLVLGMSVSQDGSLPAAISRLEAMAELHRERGLSHYLGVTLNNLVSVLVASGRLARACSAAEEAEAAFGPSAVGHEVAGLRAMAASAYAMLGHETEAHRLFEQARATEHQLALAEVLITQADIECWLGSAEASQALLEMAQPIPKGPDLAAQHEVSLWALEQRLGSVSGVLASAPPETKPSSRCAETSRRLVQYAYGLVLSSDASASTASEAALSHARRQGALIWEKCAQVLVAADDSERLAFVVLAVAAQAPYVLSMVAELVVARLDSLSDEAVAAVATECSARPLRWRPTLRRALTNGPSEARPRAAELLAQVGETQDVRLLSRASKAERSRWSDPLLGRSLARRLAPRAWIEDQGRMVIRIGSRTIDGGGVRRKPLALLAFLLTRPDFASTKDQIIDALWPDADPSDAANSLHQTLYFLRRAFEPAFAEEISPGYVSYVSDVIWLDQHLVDSRSAQCRRLLARVRAREGSDTVDALAAAYRGRFALEFAYEEWAVTYRDYLHAAYLEAIELTVQQRSEQGDLEGALRLAQAALEADPDADAVELSVLRLYRTAGAHAAAAEQHAHYSRVIADLGEEAPEIGLA